MLSHKIHLITDNMRVSSHKYEILIYNEFNNLIHIVKLYEFYRIPPKIINYATGFSTATVERKLVFDYLIDNNICKIITYEYTSSYYYIIALTTNTLLCLI